MKTPNYLLYGIVGFCLLFIVLVVILSLPPPAYPHEAYGVEYIVDPDTVVFTGKGGGFPTVSAALTGTPSNGVLVIYPGVYSDSNMTISQPVTILGVSENAWDQLFTADTVFIIGVASPNYVNLVNIAFQPPGQGVPFRTGSSDYVLDNVMIACSTWAIGTGDTIVWKNTKVYGLQYAGITNSGGIVWATNVQFNEPLTFDDTRDYYGLKNNSGNFVALKGFTAYADSTVIWVEGGAVRTYGDPIISVDGAHDSPAIYVSGSTASFSTWGGAIANSDADKATILVDTGAVAFYETPEVVNKAAASDITAPAYTSTSSGASSSQHTWFEGVVTRGTNDTNFVNTREVRIYQKAEEGWASVTAGATGPASAEMPGDSLTTRIFTFVDSTLDRAEWQVSPPCGFRYMTFEIFWSGYAAPTGGDSVQWMARALAFADEDTLDQAQSAWATIIDTVAYANNFHSTGEFGSTVSITRNDKPTLLQIEVRRNGLDYTNNTYPQPARLHGIALHLYR